MTMGHEYHSHMDPKMNRFNITRLSLWGHFIFRGLGLDKPLNTIYITNYYSVVIDFSEYYSYK
jgi:hypothetical protein